MAERRDRLNDPDEALKALYGAHTNNAITAVFVVVLLAVVLTLLTIHYWLS